MIFNWLRKLFPLKSDIVDVLIEKNKTHEQKIEQLSKENNDLYWENEKIRSQNHVLTNTHNYAQKLTEENRFLLTKIDSLTDHIDKLEGKLSYLKKQLADKKKSRLRRKADAK